MVDSFKVAEGLYCVIVDPNAGINLSNALILANTGGHASNAVTIGPPNSSCDYRRDAITVVTLRDNIPANAGFELAVL
ncbi:hypothetical protein [Kitasatospora aureofaciens]|uniref:hypothetical protein n=1 Tax=Kitasatospora aureofaciens TaxID=1894 RepID=UPI0005261484|nr:hypothetical protein [Kitasatospora aureofaciens]